MVADEEQRDSPTAAIGQQRPEQRTMTNARTMAAPRTQFASDRLAMSDSLHDDAAEQASGLDGQHEDDDDQRDGQLLAVADDVGAVPRTRFSSTPTMKPPSTAPPGLTMPPTRAAAKA